MVVDGEGFGAETFSFALGALDVEVAEELHLDLFITGALTSAAAAGAAVEGEITGAGFLFDSIRRFRKDGADVVPGSGVNGGVLRGVRLGGDWSTMMTRLMGSSPVMARQRPGSFSLLRPFLRIRFS